MLAVSSRIPGCVVVRSVVKYLNVAVPSCAASPTVASVASVGVPVKTGWKAKSVYERPSKTSRRCATARLQSNSTSVDVDVHERERDDRRRPAVQRGARRALGRLQPDLLALRPAAVHRLVDVRVRLDAARA